jgi:hypothetical protein
MYLLMDHGREGVKLNGCPGLGLASNSSNIETNIIPGGFFCFLDHPLAVLDQFEYRTFFLTGQVKKSCTCRNTFTSPGLALSGPGLRCTLRYATGSGR